MSEELKQRSMSDKLLIDRKLLERLQERLDPHLDARDWGMVCDAFRAQLTSQGGEAVAWAICKEPGKVDWLSATYANKRAAEAHVASYKNDVPLHITPLYTAAAKPDTELEADAARWNYYAPKVAGQCGVTLQEMNATIDAELAELQSTPLRT